MAFNAHLLKLVQISCVTLMTDWANVAARVAAAPYLIILAAILIGFGQHLNYKVYKLLGRDGVYYGFMYVMKKERERMDKWSMRYAIIERD